MPSWKKVITSGSNASLSSLYVANSITASAIYSSGSNQLGDATNDTQTLIGTTRISGSLAVTGSTYLPNLSYAVKNRIVVQDSTTGLLSYQSPADLTVFPYTGSAIISGSLTTIGTQQVSGSLGVTGSVYIGSTATNNVLITTAGGSSYFANDAITVQGPSFGPADAEIILHNNTTDVIGPRIDMARSYANNNLAAGNDLGELRFWRAYGNLSFTQGAYIKATAISGSTVASGPAALYFGTTPSGSITPQQRLIIQENGNVGIGAPTASATLHVSGASIIFDIPSKANGYVLSSNASGNATWVQPATLAVFPYTGSAIISGSLTVTGSVNASFITGSLSGTASWAVTSSHALTASYVNPLRQNVLLTGSLLVTQSYISKVDYIEFTSASDQPTAAARLGWNDSDGTLSLGLKGGNVDLLIGEAEFAYVYNAETSSLTKGTVVYISGSQGNRISVKRAFATTDAVSAGTIGFVAETITSGSTGFVATSGVIGKLDTSAYPAGALVYLSSSAGEYTTVKPQAPIHEVRLGYVQRVHPTVGSIYVKVDNGYEIEELHDVRIISASNGDLLTYSGSIWINSKQLTGSYFLTGSLTATSFTGSLFGTASWATRVVSASGADTQIQFNSGSVFSGSSAFTFNYASQSLQQGISVITSGQYSHAEGFSTQTIGSYSHTEGGGTAAFGQYSHAEGENTIANGYASHTEGSSTIASGDYSHAEGESTTSSGSYSHAEGINTIASGSHSHAEGNNSISIGPYSHAEGDSTIAYGIASHAEGVGNYTGQLGYNSTSITAGVITLDLGYGDVQPYIDGLTGYIILDDREYDNTYGCQLFEISSITSAIPTVINLVDTSVATTQAKIGVPGAAQPSGADVALKGHYAHSEGDQTVATGNASHAAGLYANTVGYASYAGGSNTIAYRQYQTVVGKFNKIDRVNTNNHDYAFIVGNGTSTSARDNILSVQPEANIIEIGSSTSGIDLYINGLPSDNTIPNVLTIDTDTGHVYITTGSAFGGGGSGTPTFPYTGSAIISGSLTITGSLGVTQGITGSLQGTASYASQALSASNASTASYLLPGTYAMTASWAVTASNALTASYITGSIFTSSNRVLSSSYAISSSYSITATSAVSATNAVSSSYSSYPIKVTGSTIYYDNSVNNPGPTNNVFLGFTAGNNASTTTNSNFIGAYAGQGGKFSSYSNFLGHYAGNNAYSASYSTLMGFQVGYNAGAAGGAQGIGRNNIVIGTNITLAENTTDTINLGAIIFATGCYYAIAGNPYSGSRPGIGKVGINNEYPNYTLDVSGSGNYTNNLTVTGSFTVVTGSSVEFQVTNTGVKIGNAVTDVHTVTGSLNVSGSFTATTLKAGSGSVASFGGSPLTSSITFTAPFANNSYAITVTGEDARTWTIQSKVSGSFVINSNSTVALTGPVYWIATPFNL